MGQMWMFDHIARFSSDDPAHRILSCGNPVGWKRDRGRPLSSWLRQMEGFCRRVGTNRALAKEDAQAYRDSWRSAAKALAAGGASFRSKYVRCRILTSHARTINTLPSLEGQLELFPHKFSANVLDE